MYETITVERDRGVTWLTLNRPDKRNAMNPRLLSEMIDALGELEGDPDTQVLVLTGAGDTFCAGMDLQEFFRELDGKPARQLAARWQSRTANYHRLRMFAKPTIAAVNGWCFGGAFTPLVSCDFAIAAEEAVFGLSEINWGIIPGGLVSRDLALVMSYRDALYYLMTGKTFTAREAKEMRLVNEVVPRARLREAVRALADDLMKLNPATLWPAKEAFKTCLHMDYEQASDYLQAKIDQLQFRDPERGRAKGMRQFLDEKRYRPGLEPYDRQS